MSIAETTEKAVKNIMASIASSGNHALRSGFAGKQVPEHLKEKIRRFHQEYDYAQHGVKTGKNAQLVDQLGLTEYFLDRFAVAGSPADIVTRIRALSRLGLKNLWLSSPGDDPSALDLMGQEVLPRLNNRVIGSRMIRNRMINRKGRKERKKNSKTNFSRRGNPPVVALLALRFTIHLRGDRCCTIRRMVILRLR